VTTWGARVRRAATIGVLYAALTLVMTWPVGVQPAAHRMGGGADPSLYVWTIGWGVHALTTQPWAAFDANIFFPHKYTLAYSENLLGSSLLAIPVVWLTGDPLAATNIVAVLAVWLCAMGGYFLGRQLGFSRPAAFLCGVIFAFTPPRFARLPQMHMGPIQWVPFALAFLHRYFQRGRAWDLRWAGAFLSLQALTSGHGAALLVLGGAIMTAFRLAAGEPLALLKRVRDVGAAGVLLMSPAVLSFIPYWLARREVSIERRLDDVGVTLSSYLASPAHVAQYMVGLLPDWTWLRQQPDVYLFPGLLPIALALMAFWVRDRRVPVVPDRWWRRLGGTLTVVALLQLALAIAVVVNDGVFLKIAGTRILKAHGWTPWLYAAVAIAARLAILRRAPFMTPARLRVHFMHGDARWLYLAMGLTTLWMTIGPPLSLWQWIHWVPGLSFIRVPSRFMMLGMLALAVLAAAGFDRWSQLWTARVRTVVATVLAILLCAEFATMPVDSRPFTLEIPAVDRWLNTQAKPFSIVEIPVSASHDDSTRADITVRYMLHTLAHYQPTVLGYSGVEPPGYKALHDAMIAFPTESGLQQLADLGVTYAVVHMDYYPEANRADVDARLKRFSAWLRLVHEDGAGRVYAITRPSS
jgi:hypothetical protein